MKVIHLFRLLPLWFWSSVSFAASGDFPTLPLKYRCKHTAEGGIAYNKKQDVWYGTSFSADADPFTLTIASFQSSDKKTAKRCDVAIEAEAKREDRYSQHRREIDQDVCALREFESLRNDKTFGPVIDYCLRFGTELVCKDFSFSVRTLSFFSGGGPLLQMGHSRLNVSISAGECKKL